jgi:pyridoxal phosphate enzyme (YggS family)
MPEAALADRLAEVDGRIRSAAVAAGRDPAELTRIVVTKFHPASLVRELAGLGVTDVGENRHQEAQAKAGDLADLALRWHFVGQLQSNKARAVRAYASAIHSLDRPTLVTALAAEQAADLDVFIEVDLSGEPGRGGVRPGDLSALVEAALAASGIRLRGLMTVAPLGVEPVRAFARMRELSETVRTLAPEAAALSMGMSGDFEAAIREGATHLRVGTAITGNRPAAR